MLQRDMFVSSDLLKYAKTCVFNPPIKVAFPGNLVNPEVNLILIITDYNL